MDRKTCPSCGAEIDPDHPQGLCPACLLQEGLKPDAPAVQGDPVRKALEAKLQGQYRLIRLLGRGGMGAVYLARDLTLDREVAIKVVKTDEGAREVYDRLRREAKTAARLSHPNIVPLHAFGEVEGMPYFVMGYVRGESLADRLRRDGKLPEDEGRRVLAEIADALDHAHRQGVVHRDVKPDNVLLDDESGRALLTDFGVAKALGKGETLTRTGSVVGTPQYMSPEQAAGRADIDARSDIYSLGVMAYAMLAGRLPFEGGTHAEVLTKHLTQQPPPLRSLAAAVSDPTVQAVERCLAKDPAMRWPDARSLKLALGAVEESTLPDALQGAEGKGLPSAAFVTMYMLLFSLTRPPVPVLIVQAGVFSFLYLFGVMRLRREGFSFAQAQGAIWREPAWWPSWYPTALRRRGNVWDRLPASVRHLRWWLGGGWFLIFVFAALVIASFRLRFVDTRALGLVMGAVTLVVSFCWPILRARALRELRRTGLGLADIHRVMMSVPPSRRGFWARPHIEAILAPAPRAEATRRSDSPHDHLQSILRHGEELSGPLRPLGAEAAVAARQMIAAIEHADREISELARNLEPGEEQRLADKIEALAPVSGRGDENAPMRQLLEKQLELIRGLSGRVEEARAARSRRVEMLKTLNLHLASLRARSAETPSEVRSLSERVRALCDEIGSQGVAFSEGATVAGSGIDAMPTRERPGATKPRP
jgi:hypothetical protein